MIRIIIKCDTIAILRYKMLFKTVLLMVVSQYRLLKKNP